MARPLNCLMNTIVKLGLMTNTPAAKTNFLKDRFIAAQGPFIFGTAINKTKNRTGQQAPCLRSHGLNERII